MTEYAFRRIHLSLGAGFYRVLGWNSWIDGLVSGLASPCGRPGTEGRTERADDLGRARDHCTHLV